MASLPFALFALASAACDGSNGVSADPAATEAESLEVQVAEAKERSVDRRVEVVGTLLALEQVVFTSKMPGTVQEAPFDFGDRVAKGQLLIGLDPTEYRIGVDRARSGLAEALASLGLPADGDEARLSPDEVPAVAQAAAALSDARTKLESAALLVETRDIPQQRYLELEKTVQAREAALASAKNQVLVQVAAVRSRRAELALAEKRLADTKIRAPFDGTVLERRVSPGEYVREDAPLIALAQTHPLRLRARIPETGAAAARVGLSVSFSTDAYPDRQFSATVTSISPVLDPASRSLVCEAMVDNSAGLLKPGMFTRVDVVVAAGVPTVMAPREALLQFGGLTKVFAVGQDGSVQERVVQTGVEDDGWVEIADGALKPGEKLAVTRLDELAPGVRVRFQ